MPTLLFLLPVLLHAPVRPEFCVLVRILRCVPCALSVSFVVFILCALCMYPCVLFISVQCVRALSLFVCCYSCAFRVACSRVSLCYVYSCILCCDPALCLSSYVVHSVRSIHQCVLSTLVQCVRALSLFVCYYSLCCVKLIPVCSCVTFRVFLRYPVMCFPRSVCLLYGSISECSMYLCVLCTSV